MEPVDDQIPDQLLGLRGAEQLVGRGIDVTESLMGLDENPLGSGFDQEAEPLLART